MQMVRLYWLSQIGGWSLYTFLILLATYNENPDKLDIDLFIDLLAIAVFGVLFTHLMRLFAIRMGWLGMKLSGLIPRVLIASLVTASVIYFALTAVSLVHNNQENQWNWLTVIVGVIAFWVLILSWSAIYFTYHFFQKSRRQELDNISLEASKNEFELKNLRDQINPHFLFNSLNSIRALIDLEPAKAKTAVTTLSNLLRSSIVFGKETWITIDQELNLVENYLSLEKVRFEDRLDFDLKCQDELKNERIPPFIIQLLVENAIKHGISNLRAGGKITVGVTKKDNTLEIVVVNSGSLQKKTDTGVGLNNLKRRMDLQYKNPCSFELTEQDNNVIAKICIYE